MENLSKESWAENWISDNYNFVALLCSPAIFTIIHEIWYTLKAIEAWLFAITLKKFNNKQLAQQKFYLYR